MKKASIKPPETQLAVFQPVGKSVSTRMERPELSETLRQYLQQSQLALQLEAAKPEHRRAELRKCRDAGLIANVMQGFWLADIEAAEGTEAVRAACAELNIGKTTRYNSVAQFRRFNQFHDLDVVQALAALEPSKFDALTFGDDEWTEFARGESVRGLTLETSVEMTRSELQKQQRDWQLAHDDQVQKLERDNAKLRNDLDIANNLRKTLARAGAALQAEEDLPPFALTVRQEFLALTESMSFCLDNLQAIAAEHLFAEVKHPDAHRYQPVAAATAYFALNGIHARAWMLLKQMREAYPDDLGMVTLDAQLTPAEIKRHEEQREQLLAVHQAAAKARENARENNRPGKPGAKRK